MDGASKHSTLGQLARSTEEGVDISPDAAKCNHPSYTVSANWIARVVDMKTREVLFCTSVHVYHLIWHQRLFWGQLGKFDMKIISTQMKVTLTSSTEKPAAELIFGKNDVQSISKQMKENSLSSMEKPVAEMKQKHFFVRLDVTNIQKQVMINDTSSTEKPVPDMKRNSIQK